MRFLGIKDCQCIAQLGQSITILVPQVKYFSLLSYPPMYIDILISFQSIHYQRLNYSHSPKEKNIKGFIHQGRGGLEELHPPFCLLVTNTIHSYLKICASLSHLMHKLDTFNVCYCHICLLLKYHVISPKFSFCMILILILGDA